MNYVDTILKLIDNNKNEFIKIREHLHKYPELGENEYKTTEFLKKHLINWGYEILDFGMDTGVFAILNKDLSENLIAIRSDIDALPLKEETLLPYASINDGIAHCCGHDIHMSGVLLTAKLLANLKNEINGSILFIFQPAEETLSGSKNVIKSGIFNKYMPKEIIATHTWPYLESGKIGLLKKEFMASSDNFNIKVIGSGGHGAHPEDCVDPVVASAYIITSIQTIISRYIEPLDNVVISIGKIYGGNAVNIIPNEVSFEGSIRTTNNITRKKVHKKLTDISKQIAAGFGAKAEVSIFPGPPAVVNNPEIVEKIEEAGIKILGKDNVVYLEKPSMGSEDFAEYLQIMPGALFRTGTSNSDPNSKLGLHNSKVVFDTDSLFTTAKVMSLYVLNYFE